jgi:hypothetical protein
VTGKYWPAVAGGGATPGIDPNLPLSQPESCRSDSDKLPPPNAASTGDWRGAPGWVRTSLCAWPFGTLLLVEHKRLVALGAAQLHTRVVYRQRFAVG